MGFGTGVPRPVCCDRGADQFAVPVVEPATGCRKVVFATTLEQTVDDGAPRTGEVYVHRAHSGVHHVVNSQRARYLLIAGVNAVRY